MSLPLINPDELQKMIDHIKESLRKGMEDGLVRAPAGEVVDNDYPHRCPKCKGPAYIGFSKVDCKGGCR